MNDYEPLLGEDELAELADALEEGDVTALLVTAEVATRNRAFVLGVLSGLYTVRQEGNEFVFLREGKEQGRIGAVARPSGASA